MFPVKPIERERERRRGKVEKRKNAIEEYLVYPIQGSIHTIQGSIAEPRFNFLSCFSCPLAPGQARRLVLCFPELKNMKTDAKRKRVKSYIRGECERVCTIANELQITTPNGYFCTVAVSNSLLACVIETPRAAHFPSNRSIVHRSAGFRCTAITMIRGSDDAVAWFARSKANAGTILRNRRCSGRSEKSSLVVRSVDRSFGLGDPLHCC